MCIDLTFIYGKVLRHTLDTATRFSALTCLCLHGKNYGCSMESILLPSIECSCTICIVYIDRIKTDRGSVFSSDKWRALSEKFK